MEPLENLSLAKIVLQRPEAIILFEKHNLDFCCGGKQTLTEALKGNTEKLELIKKELVAASGKSENKSTINYEMISLTELIDYIIGSHHHYVKEIMPLINEHVQRISTKHSERHAELKEIASLFTNLKKEMEQHMLKEEVVLFPAIKQLETWDKKRKNRNEILLLETPIQIMETEHEIAGHALQEIRKLSNNFSAPEDACTTYRLTFEELKIFELDLHRHVHLENNILFPKALELQKKQLRSNLT